MPASLTQLSRNRGRVTLDFGGGATLTIDYRPLLITPRQLHRLNSVSQKPYAQMSDAEKADQMALLDEQTHLLADCLVAWDLLDALGQPIPPTYEGLLDVDTDAQGIILSAIIEDQRAPKQQAIPPVAPVGNQAVSTVASSSPSPSAPQPVPLPPAPSPNGTGI